MQQPSMSIAGASIKPHHFSECLARRMAADIIKGETDYSEQGHSPHPFWKDGDRYGPAKRLLDALNQAAGRASDKECGLWSFER